MRQLFSIPALAAGGVALILLTACHKQHTPPPPTSASLVQELAAADLLANALTTQVRQSGGTNPPGELEVDRLSGIYDDLAKRYPHSAEVRISHGSFLWSFRRGDGAMKKWEEAAQLDPYNAEAMARLGGGYLEIGDESKSTAYFLRASQLDPANASYHFSLGTNYTIFRRRIGPENKTSPEAVLINATEEFRRAAELEAYNTEYAKAYADAFYLLAAPDWAKALTAWLHFLEVTDKKDFAYTNLARVSLKQGHHDEARSYLEHVVHVNFTAVKQSLLRQIDASSAKSVENMKN
jgi:tetratricopeptide (TPR) repeat protein